MSTLSDSDLLHGLLDGNETSFEALFLRHYDRVYGLLFRLVGERSEAEDLAQDVFMKLYARLGSGVRSHDENVSAWLYRVAMNTGYNALRDRKRLWQRNVWLVPDETTTGLDSQVAARQERAAVRAALARLPLRQAQLLLLRQMEFSYAECAAICDVAPGSVGTLLARAAQAFRREYGHVTGEGEEEK